MTGEQILHQGSCLTGDKLTCPNCGNRLNEVYFGDSIRRWWCMECKRLFVVLLGVGGPNDRD